MLVKLVLATAGWWLLSPLAAEALWALMHINEIGYVIPDSGCGSNTNEPLMFTLSSNKDQRKNRFRSNI